MDCKITLEDDQLTLENSRIRRCYRWNGGSLIGLSIEDRLSGKIWDLDGETPDCTFPDLPVEATDGKLEICGKNGYILGFRGLNEQLRADGRTFNFPNSHIECRPLCGHGKPFTATVDAQGRLPFSLPTPFSFALYEYSTI